MVSFSTLIQKFNSKGEKTGWTYIEISSATANKLNPNCKRSFRVKGKIDDVDLPATSILPMGDGSFILPLNQTIRKKLAKRKGEKVNISIAFEPNAYQLNEDLIGCLEDEPKAKTFFATLTKSHQNYFSKWIESAKTNETKVKRISKCVNALTKGWGYAEMIRDKTDHL